MMLLLSLLACEDEWERRERVWNESYGPILAQYRDKQPTADPTHPDVKGRKVFVDMWYSSAEPDPKPFEATTPEEIGVVIVGSTEQDATPSATYDNGSKGYGGLVTEVAWAHPEGELVGERSYRCSAPVVAYSLGSIDLGTSCSGDRDSRLRFAEQLLGDGPVDGSNVDWVGTQAYQKLARPYRARLEAELAESPSVKGRKALVLLEKHGKWQLQQTVHGAPTEHLAVGADQVGVVLLQTLAFDEEKVHTYPSGQRAFLGEATLHAFAHPEGKLVARGTVPCEPPDPTTYLNRRQKTLFCEVSAAARGAFLAALP